MWKRCDSRAFGSGSNLSQKTMFRPSDRCKAERPARFWLLLPGEKTKPYLLSQEHLSIHAGLLGALEERSQPRYSVLRRIRNASVAGNP